MAAWRVVFSTKTGYDRVSVDAKSFAEAKRKGVAAYKAQLGRALPRSTRVAQVIYTPGEKANPMTKPPKNVFIPVSAVRFNSNGTVSVKVSGATARKLNPSRRNVAGGAYGAGGVFHPFRSSPDYDPDRAGDDYGARTDNSGFTRRKKALKKAAAKKRKPAAKKKAKAKKRR